MRQALAAGAVVLGLLVVGCSRDDATAPRTTPPTTTGAVPDGQSSSQQSPTTIAPDLPPAGEVFDYTDEDGYDWEFEVLNLVKASTSIEVALPGRYFLDFSEGETIATNVTASRSTPIYPPGISEIAWVVVIPLLQGCVQDVAGDYNPPPETARGAFNTGQHAMCDPDTGQAYTKPYFVRLDFNAGSLTPGDSATGEATNLKSSGYSPHYDWPEGTLDLSNYFVTLQFHSDSDASRSRDIDACSGPWTSTDAATIAPDFGSFARPDCSQNFVGF